MSKPGCLSHEQEGGHTDVTPPTLSFTSLSKLLPQFGIYRVLLTMSLRVTYALDPLCLYLKWWDYRCVPPRPTLQRFPCLLCLLTISLTETTEDPPVPFLGQLEGMQWLNSAWHCPLPSLTPMQLKWLAWSCLPPCFGRQD